MTLKKTKKRKRLWNLSHTDGRRWCPDCTKRYYDHELNPHESFSYDPIWLELKKGKFGDFWGCPNFPKCKYSESVPKEKQLFIEDAYWG